MRILLLTSAALIGFSANSLLTRAALQAGRLDALTFMGVRLVSGALMLWLILRWRRAPAVLEDGAPKSALALFGYAILFTIAYILIGASVGALILFGAVQLTMITWGLAKGERPGPLLWTGFALAVGGLAALTLPGASRPDLAGAALMAVAGMAWGVYSLRGRSAPDPVAANARNFLWASLWAALPALALVRLETVTPKGLMLAAVSGAVTSGLGYAVWYRALRGLGAVKAAVVQLPTPVLTALGAVLFLGEPVTGRLAGAGAAVLAGVALVLASKSRAVSRSS